MINYGRRIGLQVHQKPAYGTVITDPFHPLSQGLVGYWLMNEGGGNRAYDISGHGNHGTLTNGPTWGGSKFGGGVNLDGTDYVDVGTMDNFGSEMGSDWSVSSWFKTTSASVQTILGTINDGSTTFFRVTLNQDKNGDTVENDIMMIMRDQDAHILNGDINAAVNLTDGEWHNLVVAVNPANNIITCYFDGISQTIDYLNKNTPINTGNFQYPLLIGARNLRGVADQFFNGAIDEVRIWSRDLIAAEAEQLHHDPFCDLMRVPIRRYSVAAGGLSILDFERAGMRGAFRGIMRGVV